MTEMNKPIDKILDKMTKILLELMENPELLDEVKNNEKGFYVASKITNVEGNLLPIFENDVFYLKLSYKKWKDV